MQTVGLAMIAKNEADALRYCLESVKGLVSQIVVGDTGSTDETASIARAYGATVVSVPWEDHFAKARNAVLERMTTDWVLVLDADEELDSGSNQLVRERIESTEISAYYITLRLYMPSARSYSMGDPSRPNDSGMERAKRAGSYHDQKVIRLFRRIPEIYYFGRVHELLEYRVCALGLAFPDSGIVAHNFGYLDDVAPEVKARKDAYYRKLGHLKVQEEKDNCLAWFDLGKLEYESFQNFEVALSCFRRATRLHPPFARAWLFAGEINLQTGDAKSALAALKHADSTGEAPAWRERLRGDIQLKVGQTAQAKEAYAKALQLSGSDPLIESRLGYSEVLTGESQSGFERLRRAVELMPHRSEAHDSLVKACIFAGDLRGAAEAAERFAAHVRHPKTFLRAAVIRAELKEFEAAEALVCQGLCCFPESVELTNARQELKQR